MGDLDSKNTIFTNKIQGLNIKNRDMHQSKWGNQQTMGISSGNNVRIGEKSRPRGPRIFTIRFGGHCISILTHTVIDLEAIRVVQIVQ